MLPRPTRHSLTPTPPPPIPTQACTGAHTGGTYPDASAVGDKLQDSQRLYPVGNVEVFVKPSLDLSEGIGNQDDKDNDHIQ